MTLLTDTKARNVKAGSTPLAHGGVTGLALHPSPSHKGQGKWVLRYVSPVTGKRRNAGLGSYPDIGIAEAAKQGRFMREKLANGQDPLEAKANEAVKPHMPILREAAKILHKELTPGWKNAKHAQQWINTLTEYAFPLIGAMPLDQIQPRHIADVLRPIWLEKAETAGRVKQRLHAVMAWGWAHGFCQSNPVDVVNHLLPLQPGKTVRTQHQPAMPWALMPAFVTDHLPPSVEVTRQLLGFVILTAARSGEVRYMTWDEVDLKNKLWTVPAERMKAKLSHRVPLSQQAIALLKHQQGLHHTFVFPSVRKGVPLSDMVLTAFLRRMKAVSDVPGRVATAHGFRSSFRDWCSEKGYARDLAERALAHTVQNKVEAAYHRTDLLEQRRPLMQAWADFVMPNGKPEAHD
ncbi:MULTISPECIES: tyrosine-type recombinase/integrase [Rhodanobacter]|jgi:integrase|uniref:Tyrosine-type recombinase/integrase n=2 Tax=Rhodanobacter TaxID=75309 RepID=A0ABW0JXK4_9GAMM|nr:site-specific integrase [Rhodanobacter sp. Root627]KRA35166.1 integrase [Rhodanobacter sp. Root627]